MQVILLPRMQEQVNRHATLDDNWMVVDDIVYDVSKFSRQHPGGLKVMERFAGTDATAAFRS